MLLRHVARPMLASWFVYDGAQAALRPAEHVRAARAGTELVTDRLGVDNPLSDKQVTLLVRAHGAATVAAGVLLAVGKAPRTAALGLAALTVPLAVVNQPFTSGDEKRAERTRRFVANVGAIGAALIAGVDLEGRPGVQWRVAQARRDLTRSREARQDAAVASAKATAKDLEHSAQLTARDVTAGASRSARRAARKARKAVRQAAGTASDVVHDAGAAVRSTVS